MFETMTKVTEAILKTNETSRKKSSLKKIVHKIKYKNHCFVKNFYHKFTVSSSILNSVPLHYQLFRSSKVLCVFRGPILSLFALM